MEELGTLGGVRACVCVCVCVCVCIICIAYSNNINVRDTIQRLMEDIVIIIVCVLHYNNIIIIKLDKLAESMHVHVL